MSGPGQRAGQRAGKLDRLGGRITEPVSRLRREQPGGGRGGLPCPRDLVRDLSVGDLRRLTDPAGTVHIHVQAAPLEPVRLLRVTVQDAQDLDQFRRGHGREPGRQARLIERQCGDQQSADLLELMPFQHPADRRLHPQAPGQDRQGRQAAGLAALLDRQRRHGVRPGRAARFRQRLGVAQKAMGVARGCGAARQELSSPRRLDRPKIHRASVTTPSRADRRPPRRAPPRHRGGHHPRPP
jgi:hypothetical protein